MVNFFRFFKFFGFFRSMHYALDGHRKFCVKILDVAVEVGLAATWK